VARSLCTWGSNEERDSDVCGSAGTRIAAAIETAPMNMEVVIVRGLLILSSCLEFEMTFKTIAEKSTTPISRR
jgi:hypothetical protein